MKTPEHIRDEFAISLGFPHWDALVAKHGWQGYIDLMMERYAEEAATKKHHYPLRDHFAGLAMQALIDQPTIPGVSQSRSESVNNGLDSMAKNAYYVADAMLKARKTDTP